jgi:nicotinate (nicotinamide) nucleotide adenylyltransferase
MIERINNFQLVFRYHAIIEGLQGDPHPRLLIISRSKEAAARQGRKLGIFPSSFNPITKGHMAVLQRAAEIKAFKEILLVLDTQAMDKEILGATLVDRLLMVHGLFKDYPNFSVGVSNRGLFLTKVELLKGMYPRETDITFIVGYDTMKRVFDPKYYEDREGALDQLFGSCRFMVANRENQGKEALQQLMASGANRRFKGKVHFFEIPNRLAHISSSHVRQRVMEGKSFARLVPPEIGECIKEVKLYKMDRKVGPSGQRINLYDLRTQVLNRLYGLYPEGKVEIDIGQIVDSVVEGTRSGQALEALLDSIPDRVAIPKVGKSRRR